MERFVRRVDGTRAKAAAGDVARERNAAAAGEEAAASWEQAISAERMGRLRLAGFGVSEEGVGNRGEEERDACVWLNRRDVSGWAGRNPIF
jgi:hypothetical protein